MPYHELFGNVILQKDNKSVEQSDSKEIIETRTYEIFGDKYKKVDILSSELKGKVYYIISGHGGPDPGARCQKEGVFLCEDEYAYDISLRLARNLIKKGARVYIIVRDNDGIRDERLLACDYEKVKPDILCLGKALSGGVLPISAVLANSNVMDCITPGTHGSTFGGNPMASVVASASLDVIIDEDLSDNAYKMGKFFRRELNRVKPKFIVDVRGRGLMNAIEFESKEITDKICHKLLENGLLTKQTHDTVLRMSPPLTINRWEMNQAIKKITSVILEV